MFGYSLSIQQPLLFIVSIFFTIIAFISFGLVIAPIFVMNPGVRQWQNAMEFPVYVLSWIPLPDRAPARLDDSRLVHPAALLGGGRSARDLDRRARR